jgi:pyruvate/2-oxoglutarate dehydrogenase complex dihydrolipoamide dehydrogenase (E3) component
LRKEKYADLLDYYGIDLVEGLGKLEGPGRIKVGSKWREDMLASGIGCVCRLAPISAVAAAYASGSSRAS